MVCANLRVPSCAAIAFGNAIWPLTAMKNAGLESKYLSHAVGPSWVTLRATVCINPPTARSTAAAPSGASRDGSLAPAMLVRQPAKTIPASRKGFRSFRLMGSRKTRLIEGRIHRDSVIDCDGLTVVVPDSPTLHLSHEAAMDAAGVVN